MSRVATINSELDEINTWIIDTDKKFDGKALDAEADTAWQEKTKRYDALTIELAKETTREKAVQRAAGDVAKRGDSKAVNIGHNGNDPDREPGKGAVPDAFTKAFGGHSSVGDAFVKHATFLAELEKYGIKAGDPGSIITSPITTRPAVIEGASYKALVTSNVASAGYLYRAQRLPSILELLREPVRVTDLFPTVPVTGTNAVEYVKESAFTNNAAVVPEATSTTDDAALKPESELTFTLVTDTLETIAHLIPATRQILADAAQLRALIDNRLRVGLLEKLEQRVCAIVYAASGLLTQAVGADTKLDALWKAATQVRVTGRAMPESYIMHPNDYTDIRLAKDLNGNYLMGASSTVGLVTVWGIPIVDTQWATEGTPLVGDWSMFGALYEREQIQTYVTDSHSDWFRRNLIAILMEMRAILAVYRATAAAKVTGF